MDQGKLNIAKLDGSRHGHASVLGYLPAAGMRNFGDEALRVTAAENARDLGVSAAGIGKVLQGDRRFKRG